jgi:hypothetical protein
MPYPSIGDERSSTGDRNGREVEKGDGSVSLRDKKRCRALKEEWSMLPVGMMQNCPVGFTDSSKNFQLDEMTLRLPVSVAEQENDFVADDARVGDNQCSNQPDDPDPSFCNDEVPVQKEHEDSQHGKSKFDRQKGAVTVLKSQVQERIHLLELLIVEESK